MPEYKDVTLIAKEIEQGKNNLKFKNAEYAEVFASALAFVQGVIDRVPVANVAEFVKCKDCIHFATKPDFCYKLYCDEVEAGFSCIYGERKNG